jgi:predicted RecA/RadA family phage recombinase
MSEAALYKDADTITILAPAALASGQVVQLPDGRAGYVMGLKAVAAGDPVEIQVGGQAVVAKTANVEILPGDELRWDRSANTATPLDAIADADFLIGTAVDGAAAADTTVVVALNKRPVYQIDIFRDRSTTALVGTANKPSVTWTPGRAKLALDSTSEAQKADILSDAAIPVTVPFVVEGRMAIFDISAGAEPDINVGIANATHASDADSITESVFFHLDGTSLDIKAKSDDGTTEVAATDTTVDAVDDTFFDFRIDARDLTDIKLYINGARVLAATTFKLDKATGPMKLLAHIEKTTSASTCEIQIAHLAIRTLDAAA